MQFSLRKGAYIKTERSLCVCLRHIEVDGVEKPYLNRMLFWETPPPLIFKNSSQLLVNDHFALL